ncbi:hypothetical protein LB564_13870 [Mesorhizobium sp. ES1-6]|nr:hypothetical protein [Mesorhizobium sp. ES1-6]
MRREFSDALVESNLAATWYHAVDLLLGALAEFAQPAEIDIAAGFDQKNVQLMIGDADPHAFLERFAQGKSAGATQFAKPLLGIEPERQVKIATFVPDLDPRTPEFGETRHFFPERLGDRADYRHRNHLLEAHPGIGDYIRRGTKLPLAFHHIAVLLLDGRAAHVRPTAS